MNSTVTLKRAHWSHFVDIHKLIERSRNELKALAWAETATAESVREFIQRKADSQDCLLYVIHANDDLIRPIGMLELRDKHYHYQVGYWLDIHARGRGHATSAVREALKKINKPLTAQILHDNKRSISVVTRAGLRLVGADSEWKYYSSAR